MAILTKITRNVDTRAWHDTFPVHYSYTPGEAGLKFFTNLKEKGVFTGAKCSCCGKVYVPPRIYCEECFEEITDFIKLPATGSIESFTIVKEDIDGKSLGGRKAVGFIRIDSSSGGFLGNILCKNPDDVKTGMKVKARMKPASKRQGLMNDIEGFELV
ncbi:MAG: Zn-ribbon domain-containing OB-fold protein [Bacteroidetes bacterium]|nr:Zn-ribbon domain-containing OB-fold protein [Bacteroidota bacterium]